MLKTTLYAGLVTGLLGCSSYEVPNSGTGTEDAGTEDAGTTEGCQAGFQDEDGDGVCEEDCATTSLDCGPTGSCVIVEGSASCECGDFNRGEDCSECIDGSQDNDGDGACSAACLSAAESCGPKSVCDDSSGAVQCDCVMGHAGPMCSACVPGFHDDDGDGACAPCGPQPAFDAGFQGASPLVFTNTGNVTIARGAPVEFVFDHAALVANNLSQDNGQDLRIVRSADGNIAAVPHGIEGGTNRSDTRLLFTLETDLAPGQSTTEYTLFFDNPNAQPPELVTFPFQTQAVPSGGASGVPLQCDQQAAAFLSIQLRQVSDNEYEVHGREHTQDGASLGRISVVDTADGAAIFDFQFGELGGSCCSPVTNGFVDELITIDSNQFSVTLESLEFSSSRQFFGCEVFASSGTNDLVSNTTNYTIVENPRLDANRCGL